MNRAARFGLAFCIVAVLNGCNHRSAGEPTADGGAARVVNFYSWVDEIGPTTASDFEKRSGVRINTQALWTNQMLETQLLTGHSGYDVVEPSANFVQPLVSAGALLKLDKSRLPHWKDLDAALLKQVAAVDPGNEYTIPFLWGTHGIAMNTAAVTAALGGPPPRSWGLIFDPKYASRLKACGIVWMEASWTLASWAKLQLRLDPNSERNSDLDATEHLLAGALPFARYLDNYRGDSEIASGEICIETTAAGSTLQAQAKASQAGRDVKLEYFVPQEGAMLWFDMLAIPADAPHVDDAYRFLDYLLEPKVIADVTNATGFANANRASLAYVRDELKRNEWIYPSPETFARLHVYLAHSAEYERAESRMWTRVRTGEKSQ